MSSETRILSDNCRWSLPVGSLNLQNILNAMNKLSIRRRRCLREEGKHLQHPLYMESRILILSGVQSNPVIATSVYGTPRLLFHIF